MYTILDWTQKVYQSEGTTTTTTPNYIRLTAFFPGHPGQAVIRKAEPF